MVQTSGDKTENWTSILLSLLHALHRPEEFFLVVCYGNVNLEPQQDLHTHHHILTSMFLRSAAVLLATLATSFKNSFRTRALLVFMAAALQTPHIMLLSLEMVAPTTSIYTEGKNGTSARQLTE